MSASATETSALPPVNPAVQAVIEAFDEIVKPDGGSVSLLRIEGDQLSVAYAKGVNEQCVECIMEPNALAGMMKDMLADQAPEIRDVVVVVQSED
ncbi:MAG: NifU family protein [Myxococcota bacterium]